MTASLTLDPRTCALVLIDLQCGIVAAETQPRPSTDVVANAARLARACRDRGVPVILVRVDPGPDGLLFPRPPMDRPRPPFTITPDWTQLVPELGPEPGDVVVTKHQPSAFHGTDLEVQLRRRGVNTIVLGGISTNVGVESTARAAFEHGYATVFVEDAMAARATELHAFPVTHTFPTLGLVRHTAAVLAALDAGGLRGAE